MREHGRGNVAGQYLRAELGRGGRGRRASATTSRPNRRQQDLVQSRRRQLHGGHRGSSRAPPRATSSSSQSGRESDGPGLAAVRQCGGDVLPDDLRPHDDGSRASASGRFPGGQRRRSWARTRSIRSRSARPVRHSASSTPTAAANRRPSWCRPLCSRGRTAATRRSSRSVASNRPRPPPIPRSRPCRPRRPRRRSRASRPRRPTCLPEPPGVLRHVVGGTQRRGGRRADEAVQPVADAGGDPERLDRLGAVQPLNGAPAGTWNATGRLRLRQRPGGLDRGQFAPRPHGNSRPTGRRPRCRPARVTLTFNRPVNFSTVTASDLTFTGAPGRRDRDRRHADRRR